jgi:hypothetical protein
MKHKNAPNIKREPVRFKHMTFAVSFGTWSSFACMDINLSAKILRNSAMPIINREKAKKRLQRFQRERLQKYPKRSNEREENIVFLTAP